MSDDERGTDIERFRDSSPDRRSSQEGREPASGSTSHDLSTGRHNDRPDTNGETIADVVAGQVTGRPVTVETDSLAVTLVEQLPAGVEIAEVVQGQGWRSDRGGRERLVFSL
jgi:DNA-directed RNA polymerase specialized sigma54-like protein